MTIKPDAKTLIDYTIKTETRSKLMKLTEFSSTYITGILERSGSKRTGIKRVLQSSDNDYAVQEIQRTKEILVIEL